MKKYLKFFISAAAALLISLLAFSGILFSYNGSLSDMLYNQTGATDGEIVVIGIDSKALDAFGPMPWPRDIMADIIYYLNADPELAPAVIGIDVLYVGESNDALSDLCLAEAAAEGGNVVTAAAATFGSALVTSDDSFYMDSMAILAFDGPYQDLAAVTETGQINAMADKDGIIRHALLKYTVPGDREYKSFARVIYERYQSYLGAEPLPEPEVNSEGFFYLPYSASPGSYYDGVSAADVYYGEVDPSYFAGKIVLIAPYAAGMQDEYRTAADHAVPMYGIEIQANEIDAFRSGNIPNEAADLPQFIFLFIVSLLLSVILIDRRVLTGTLIWLCVSAVWIILCLAAFRAGYILHVLYLPLSASVLFIVSIAINYISAQKEKKRVTSTFGRYVDPAVLRELLIEGGSAEDLGGKSFDIAVLFVDIRGFTTMSEALEPAVVVEIINRYLTLTTECIMRYQGTLDKFVGDCTMAFWNAPLPHKDPVYLACCAAMDMVEGSKALGEELEKQFGRTVSFGIGVHYGPAVVGNIGAPMRMDYTAIGDTVNTAARLEANAPGGKILISRAVADILGSRAETTSLGGSIRLKGKSEGFETLTLDSLRRTDSNK